MTAKTVVFQNSQHLTHTVASFSQCFWRRLDCWCSSTHSHSHPGVLAQSSVRSNAPGRSSVWTETRATTQVVNLYDQASKLRKKRQPFFSIVVVSKTRLCRFSVFSLSCRGAVSSPGKQCPSAVETVPCWNPYKLKVGTGSARGFKVTDKGNFSRVSGRTRRREQNAFHRSALAAARSTHRKSSSPTGVEEKNEIRRGPSVIFLQLIERGSVLMWDPEQFKLAILALDHAGGRTRLEKSDNISTCTVGTSRKKIRI